MAGSRLEKFGTVFTRVRDLIRAGVVKREDRPVWYDVYAAFPPKREPLYDKRATPPRVPPPDLVPAIFYKEDEIRAKFFEVYGNGPRPFDLLNPNFVSSCQKFVMKYSELESRGTIKPEMLFEETAVSLLGEGVYLRKRGGPAVASEPQDPLPKIVLADILAEDRDTETDVPEKAPQAETVNPDSQTSS